MLSRGVDVSQGQLLQYAIFRDTDVNEVISMLVDKGAPLDAAMHQDGHTLMRFWPMSLGTLCILQQSSGDGCNSAKDANGRTAVELAQQLNQTEVVRLLESKL
ncbi:hypothetical protein N7519_007250 [Penicillium mononematosum]|uniref:uncharacterized protein n=1 Tax=Penicillium mononematosum TaxID=268346 RepID=UPI002547B547|nr:uncharacterized protein N7519_007250 [Penicillium mononematosum]KAJ6185949.1 hypothetical protein N7519_007250 [Penicillium mononematosum]